MIKIYTDGGCKVNGRKINQGGYGIVVVENNVAIEKIAEWYKDSTNNRMELMAIIRSLMIVLDKKYTNVEILSDSMYCVNGLNDWSTKWAKSGFSSDIKNQDLWIVANTLLAMIGKGKVKLSWIKGHNGDKYNEMADELAKSKMDTNPNLFEPFSNEKKRKLAERIERSVSNMFDI